jgi:hypothetical protein
MIARRLPAPIALGLAVAMLGSALVGLQVWRDAVYGEPAPGEAVLYLRSASTVKRLSLSYSAFLADIYWIRTVQYYGGMRLSNAATRRYDLLYPLLDITTTLDPQFNLAYRFGAIFLAEPYPGGAGRTDQAIALLEKGFRLNPRRWHYLQDLGFVHYWWRGDYAAAAYWFEKASKVPGAPMWLTPLAAVTLTQGGDRQRSRWLWQSMRDSAEEPWAQNMATLRLGQLDALDAIDGLTALVRTCAARVGAPPSSWEAMIQAGCLRGVPVDPTGLPYVLVGPSGVVTVSPDSRLHPLPVGARADRLAR